MLHRLGLLGDLHAEGALLEQSVAFLRAEGVETIATTGDIVDGPGDVNACIELLQREEVICVRGNHDRWILNDTMRDLPDTHLLDVLTDKSRAFLSELPTTMALATATGSALLCHGLGEDDMAGVWVEDYGYGLEVNDRLHELINSPHRYVLCGHTHQRNVRKFDGTTLINAGTLCEDPGLVIVDFAKAEARLYDLIAGQAILTDAASL